MEVKWSNRTMHTHLYKLNSCTHGKLNGTVGYTQHTHTHTIYSYFVLLLNILGLKLVTWTDSLTSSFL